MIACGGPGPDVPASPREGLREGRPPPGSKHTSLWSWLFGTLLSRGESLRGKRALVSGSGGGLGRELSVLLVQQGCKVICVDQDAVQVQETLGLTRLDDRPAARGYACDWRNPGEALGLSRAVATTEGGVDIIFVVPESNNNNESAVDSTGKIVGNEFWPLLGFLPGMLARARGHVVHVLDEHNAHKTGMVADAWIESLQEVGADVRYTKVYLHADQARHRPCRAEDAARSIVAAVRQGSSEVRIAYPIC